MQVDRKTTCPFLLKVYCKEGRHSVASDYNTLSKRPVAEFDLYTWKDATMREIVTLIQNAYPPAKKSGNRLSLRVFVPSANGIFANDLGSLSVYPSLSRSSPKAPEVKEDPADTNATETSDHVVQDAQESTASGNEMDIDEKAISDPAKPETTDSKSTQKPSAIITRWKPLEEKTLSEIKFEIGDFLELAIQPNAPHSARPAPKSAPTEPERR